MEKKDYVKEVIEELKLNLFCYGTIKRFPKMFYTHLTDQERAEVAKRVKNGELKGGTV